MTKIPSYVLKARAYLRRTQIRETPALAELARLQRALERASKEHGLVAFAAAAQTLGLALEAELDDSAPSLDTAADADELCTAADADELCTAAADATPPLFPEA